MHLRIFRTMEATIDHDLPILPRARPAGSGIGTECVIPAALSDDRFGWGADLRQPGGLRSYNGRRGQGTSKEGWRLGAAAAQLLLMVATIHGYSWLKMPKMGRACG